MSLFRVPGCYSFRHFFFLGLCLVLCSCSLPANPTITPIPSETSTPTQITPTLTPTITPTATATELPPYLSVDPADLKGVKVVLWHTLRDEPKKLLDEQIQKFNSQNSYGITVLSEFDLSESDQDIHVSDGLSDGELPNLLIAQNSWLRQWEAEGLKTVDLAGYMQHPQSGFDALKITPIIEPMLAQETVDGKLLALPLWHEPALLFYNKTWAQVLGFPETPDSFAEFAEQVCAASKAVDSDDDSENNGTGGWIIQSDVPAVTSWLLNFGAQADSMSAFWDQDSEGDFVKTSQWLRELYDKGCIWNSRLKEPYEYFAKRYALFYSGTYADAQRQVIAFSDSEAYAMDNWDIVPYPRKTKDGKAVDPKVYTLAVSAAIPSGDIQTQYAAWLFLSFLMQDERAAELALRANSWPVQDSPEITRLYQNSGKDKLLQTLSWREEVMPFPVNGEWNTDSLVLSDGFANVFSLTTKMEDIPGIWKQIGESIAEIKTINAGE